MRLNTNYAFVREEAALKTLKKLNFTVFCFAKKQKHELIQLTLLFTFDSLDSWWNQMQCKTVKKRGVLRDVQLQYTNPFTKEVRIVHWVYCLGVKFHAQRCMCFDRLKGYLSAMQWAEFQGVRRFSTWIIRRQVRALFFSIKNTG